jgi:hypothetical protein
MTYDSPAWEFAAEPFSEIAATARQSSPYHWQSSKAHTGSRYTYGVQNSQAEVINNHDDENIRNIGEEKARLTWSVQKGTELVK